MLCPLVGPCGLSSTYSHSQCQAVCGPLTCSRCSTSVKAGRAAGSSCQQHWISDASGGGQSSGSGGRRQCTPTWKMIWWGGVVNSQKGVVTVKVWVAPQRVSGSIESRKARQVAIVWAV